MTRTIILDYINGISVENARLGRLVLNIRHPHQDYYDPSSSTAASSVTKIKSYENFRDGLNSTSLVAKLAAFLNAGFTYKHKGTKDISAVDVTTTSLHNSGTWFEEACVDAKARQWMERAIKRGRSIYLIVGHCVLTDAQSNFTQCKDFTTSANPLIPALSVPGSLVDIRAEASQQNIYNEKLSVHFPGQVVCAVQYRKLVFSWFSCKTLGNAQLEPDNRWIVGAAFRGEDGVGEKYVLEVALNDDENNEEGDSEGSEESEESEDE
ncbi:uncharacterized protein Triagg1_575 [Trichoderma aggressivum f. europaeum]|uniref:Uncharacterized protein n=1 Tax=Trichoderma aggressivum f. europaeum TaxID=173218 RepID=A0AAE1M3Z0_9HYPO|nr:hypothetical protein Triagg1_575 [Trichoderma aggressivum f. europaeum]